MKDTYLNEVSSFLHIVRHYIDGNMNVVLYWCLRI